MSGIPIHTQSPISSVKATAVTPQTAYVPPNASSTTPATTTIASSTQNSSAAQPGAAAPAPTQASFSQGQSRHATPTIKAASTSYDGPPPPQPGVAPTPSLYSYGTAVKSDLPPPPKVGEKPKAPEFYSSTRAAVQTYPPQMSMLSPARTSCGQPVPSENSANATSSIPPPASRSSDGDGQLTYQKHQPSAFNSTFPAPSLGSENQRRSLEHPPGYVQNAYATDMTPDQRFATENINRSVGSPVLGYVANRRASDAGNGGEESIWDAAKKWAKSAGEKASEVEGKIWSKIDGK
ncbi:hypothetical protein MMC12_005924 [Toensbergia leucococca]|nr:hypothetical protein [Toensbergia leucococca]